MHNDLALLFHELADLSPSARARYFEQRQVSPELRAEVESLLAFDTAKDASFTEVLAGQAEELLRPRGNSPEGARCGPYQLVRLLGRGGAGEVFLGERTDGQIEHRVAIKLLRYGLERRELRDRFLQERQILASLQHPGIIRLLDAGQTVDGKPYLVMDYIDGIPIDVHARDLDVRGKLDLFLRVCEAVSYAHRNLIVHRDLKPSNILVDASGEPKLLDFGIAKILDAATDQTRTQERLLTPDYASPEQVRGEAQTTATDIYSLGAVLYRLLTGRSAHAFLERTPRGMAAEICTVDPVPASTLNPGLPRDLDFILRKALRKEPDERYSSVEAMADDLHAFLEWRPVSARSGNTWYRTRKFARRYRALVAAAGLIVLGLSIGLYIADRERIIAQERFQQLHQLSAKIFDVDRDISKLAGATQARRALVSASLQYLEGLGAAAHGDLDLTEEIAAAYERVAQIQGVPTNVNLGDFKKAEESLQKGDGLIDRVLASRPQSATALLTSAAIARDRMILANSERRNQDAKIYAGKAIERLERLIGLGGLSPDQRESAANLSTNIALFHMNVHLYDNAIRYARQAIDISKSLPFAARSRAANLSLIGSSLRSEGHLEEALLALREAHQLASGPIYSNPVDRALNVYGILLREARTLGQQDGISLGRSEEAISVYQQAVDLTDGAADTDPNDQASRDRLAVCARELAELLSDRDPQRSLAVFDLALRRLGEIKNNLRARREQAQTMAESSYPLRALHRLPEARQRIDGAFALLRETKDYPSDHIGPESEVAVALRAQADHESEAGDRRRAVAIYERLLAATIAAKPDALNDLVDAKKVSILYHSMARAYSRAGDFRQANAVDERRTELWRHWAIRLPHNLYIERELAAGSGENRPPS